MSIDLVRAIKSLEPLADFIIEDNVILGRLTIQQINDIEKDIIEWAKLYHYLDCSDFRDDK